MEHLIPAEKAMITSILQKVYDSKVTIATMPFYTLDKIVPSASKWNSQGSFGRLMWKLHLLNQDKFEEVKDMNMHNGHPDQTYGVGFD